MVNVGIVGIGFMGMIHYLAYQRVRGAKVAAICSRDPGKLAGDWRGIKGNFGPEGTQMELGAIGRYSSYSEMLADPKIQLVDICLPPAMHAEAVIAAFRAGKHVLCEKPLALSAGEAARMERAAKQSRKQLLVAHVLPYFPEYAFALKVIRSGKYGALLGGHFKRIISDPLWIKDFYNPRAVGGPLVDLHIHDAHFIRLVAGMPSAVFTTGRTHRGGEVPEFVTSQFIYDADGPVITASSGVIRQQGRPFTHGFEIHLERATLCYDLQAFATEPHTLPLTVLTKDGQVQRPEFPGGDSLDAFVSELKETVRAIQAGKPSDVLGGALAIDALELCERQARSLRLGKLVRI